MATVYNEPGGSNDLHVCLRRGQREVQLLGGDSVTGYPRLAGRFLAVRDHYDSGSPDPCFGMTVQVYDLTVRPPEPDFPIDDVFSEIRGNCEGDISGPVLPTSIVLKPNGAVAYMWCVPRGIALLFGGPYRCAPGRSRMVVKHDARTPRDRIEVLDQGASIAASSLRLRGGTLTWRKGRSVKSGRLR